MCLNPDRRLNTVTWIKSHHIFKKIYNKDGMRYWFKRKAGKYGINKLESAQWNVIDACVKIKHNGIFKMAAQKCISIELEFGIWMILGYNFFNNFTECLVCKAFLFISQHQIIDYRIWRPQTKFQRTSPTMYSKPRPPLVKKKKLREGAFISFTSIVAQ